MQTALDILKTERSKLDQAISLLENGSGKESNTTPARLPKKRRGIRNFTAAQRREQSLRMKRMWKKRRLAKETAA